MFSKFSASVRELQLTVAQIPHDQFSKLEGFVSFINLFLGWYFKMSFAVLNSIDKLLSSTSQNNIYVHQAGI